MLKVVAASSEEPDTVACINEVLDSCVAQLDGTPPRAAIAFAAVDFDLPDVVTEIRRWFPNIELAGCTTDGEIANPAGFSEDSIALVLFASDAVEITVGIGAGAISDPRKAAAEAVGQAKSKTELDPVLCIALPEGLGASLGEVVAGLRAALGENFPIVGGAAGDQLQFSGTHQICNGDISSDAVVVMLFSGPLCFATPVATGWVPMGKRHRVTRASGMTVYEIDHRPAIELYDEYLQSRSIFFPLAVYEAGHNGYYLSVPQAFDEETGSVTLLNAVPENAEVQLAEASRDEIVAGSKESMALALSKFPGGTPQASILFSCAGRRAVLGTRTGEEYSNIVDFLKSEIPTAGFYSYGEICPLETGGSAVSHNCSFVTVLLGEQPA